MPCLLFLKERQNLKLSSAANYRWIFYSGGVVAARAGLKCFTDRCSKIVTMRSSIAIVCFIVSLALVKSDNNIDPPSVRTKLGEIIGTIKTTNVFGDQMEVERYLGVPYAEPPVGDLRFRKPVPKRPFLEPFIAQELGAICYQVMSPIKHGYVESEDCLFINLYVPSKRRNNLAVMIFFHGGGFWSGTGNPYTSDTLATYGDVIVVTVNYRLSLLGFLSTGDEHAPGNYGLWDQQLAIRWVKENIAAFGGDAGSITIFGESAGAVSVVYQSLFEGNDGLFQRAISQSGSITARLAGEADQKKHAEKLGKLVGCDKMDSESLLECLRGIGADTLNATVNDFSNGFVTFPMPFTPRVDGEIIKEDPNDLLLSDSEKSAAGRAFFSSVDFLGGIDVEEGIMLFSFLMGIMDPQNFEPNRTYYEEYLIPKVLSFVFGEDAPQPIKDLVVHEYTDWTDPENMEKRRSRFIDIFTEIFFSLTLLDTVGRHETLTQGQKNTYMFVLEAEPSQHLLPSPTWCRRATHGDELQYVFFDDSGEMVKILPGRENYAPQDWEKDLAKDIMSMWTNFAKTG